MQQPQSYFTTQKYWHILTVLSSIINSCTKAFHQLNLVHNSIFMLEDISKSHIQTFKLLKWKVIKRSVWWNDMRFGKLYRTCSHSRFSLWLSSSAPQGRRWEACRTQSASGTRSDCRPSAERSGTAWSCCSGMQTNRWLKMISQLTKHYGWDLSLLNKHIVGSSVLSWNGRWVQLK